MPLATLLRTASIFLQKKHNTTLSVGEKSGWTGVCLSLTSAAELSQSLPALVIDVLGIHYMSLDFSCSNSNTQC